MCQTDDAFCSSHLLTSVVSGVWIRECVREVEASVLGRWNVGDVYSDGISHAVVVAVSSVSTGECDAHVGLGRIGGRCRSGRG